MSSSLSTQLHLSRDSIREQIIDYIQTYLELENVDLTKSSFLSFLINIVSTLTSNLMFYQTSVYNEFFLTKAQLPESILNLAAFLGYSPQDASYATANVLVRIPLTFSDPSNTITLPEGFKFKADDIEFVTFYDTTITITNNSTATVLAVEGSKKYYLPVNITSSNFSFVLPLKQYKESIQEFQIDSDLAQYQFVTLDVPIDGKVSSMTVEIQEPNSASWTTWTSYSSLYLLTSTTQGYVSRKTDSGRKLYFGNGLIGIQPTPGSTVKITTLVTKGSEGNVIAGSIKTGDRLYTTNASGIREIVNYTVTNTSAAINGEDDESVEETRTNAIASITSLGRLVTENDYSHMNVVIPDSPLSSNSLAVLKRSDIKVNDIQVYTPILFGDDLVPTRNAINKISSSTSYLERGSTITIAGEDYYTLFDLTIDSLNASASYHYIMQRIEEIPLLVTSYASSYNLYADNLIVEKIGNTARFKLHYNTTETNPELCTCELNPSSTSLTYSMTNDSTSSYFTYDFTPYTNVPENQETYYFTIKDPSSDNISQYSATLIFRKDLDDFMLSNVVVDSTSYTIYDIPVVKASYYDSINQTDFESQVLQNMMESLTLEDYRMLTDFTNIKFTNTTGYSTNMKYNPINRTAVINILSSVPSSASVGSRYIITSGTYQNYIYECTDSTSVPIIWQTTEPTTGDIVYVTNLAEKYLYSAGSWAALPTYEIPLQIDLEIFTSSSYSGSSVELANTVKDTLISSFSSRFGSNVSLYRSEIINVIQGIEGVDHCRLHKPETDIFFNFKLTDLTEDELLEYGPEYIYFEEDDIRIRIYPA